jgi:hypothetical protein
MTKTKQKLIYLVSFPSFLCFSSFSLSLSSLSTGGIRAVLLYRNYNLYPSHPSFSILSIYFRLFPCHKFIFMCTLPLVYLLSCHRVCVVGLRERFGVCAWKLSCSLEFPQDIFKYTHMYAFFLLFLLHIQGNVCSLSCRSSSSSAAEGKNKIYNLRSSVSVLK